MWPVAVYLGRISPTVDNAKEQSDGSSRPTALRVVAGALTPVPGGIGPVTVVLLEHTIAAAEAAQDPRRPASG
jgi:5,10-methylene-tetrahydrofolate dehydrogenase/methenyl tetrahydrofolate cyclohydrolase